MSAAAQAKQKFCLLKKQIDVPNITTQNLICGARPNAINKPGANIPQFYTHPPQFPKNLTNHLPPPATNLSQ
jgi:hypothetical protein